MTLGLLGAVICPLMNLLILAQKINSEGQKDYRVLQTAQYFMEETKAMGGIDTEIFDYNSEGMCYERTVLDVLDDYSAEIRVIPATYGLHYIEVDILSDGEVVESLGGSIVYE